MSSSFYPFRSLFSVVLFFLSSLLLPAQAFRFIPTPQQVTRGEGMFRITAERLMYITEADDTTLLFPANLFIREVKNDLQFEPEYTLDVKKASILMGYRGWSKKFDKLTAPLAGDLKACGEEGYVLQVTPERIVLVANSDAGIFYGVMTLNQLVRGNRRGDAIPAVTIVDRPALRWRAWQDDISRGPIPTLDFLKEEVRTMAGMKMNAFTLYTEHVFRLKSHPDIAPPDGITAEEIRELSRFAKKYHVELIGNFQAFGHFRKILEKPAYRHLAETPSVISPAFEETYRLLEDILGEIAQAYDSRYFIINCDEVFGLGSGPAKTMVDTMGLAGVYAYHINLIAKILRKYHKIPMMWGDIAKNHPEIIPLLPDSIIVLPWAYHAAPSFREYIEPFRKDSLPFWVCPGVSCWNRIFPSLTTAEVNISHFVRDGHALGGEGMLNTTWDDDGENFFNYNWLPLGWGAECAWHPVTGGDTLMQRRYDRFVGAWDPLFFGAAAGVTRAMLRLDSLKFHPSSGGLRDAAFWQPMIDEDYDTRNTALLLNDAMALEKEAAAVMRELQRAGEKVVLHREALGFLDFSVRRVLYLARKNALRYRLNDPAERSLLNASMVTRNLHALASQLGALKADYERLWKVENRPWWLDTILARYDRAIRDLNDTPYHLFIQPDDSLFAERRTVTIISLFPHGEILYTLDGSDPDSSSLVYRGPFVVDSTVVVKARFRNPSPGGVPVFAKKIFVYKGPVKEIRLEHPYSQRYTAGGVVGLVDGVHGSENFRDGHWMGFVGEDMVAILQLKKPVIIDTVKAEFLQQQHSWILFPSRMEVYLSQDGKEWQPFCRHENDIPGNIPGTLIRTFSCYGIPREAQYVKVVAKNVGTLPAWHPAAGGKAWVFVDEIEIK